MHYHVENNVKNNNLLVKESIGLMLALFTSRSIVRTVKYIRTKSTKADWRILVKKLVSAHASVSNIARVLSITLVCMSIYRSELQKKY